MQKIITLTFANINKSMTSKANPTTTGLFTGYPPWAQLLITLGATMVGFQLLGGFLGIAIAYPFYPGAPDSYLQHLSQPAGDEGMRIPFLIAQGISQLVGFFLVPWLLVRFLYKGRLRQLAGSKTYGLPVLIAVLITFFFMGVNAPFIEWNKNVSFPEALAGLEKTLRALEDSLAGTSEFITRFGNTGELLLGLMVVAVIPGIGEELVFRGLVQNHVFRITKNIHLAIWAGALLFSLFHLQFFGLVPRMLLGVMFGYLYYFSGNIVYPMVAHFFNNGFTLVMMYLYQVKAVDFNIEDTETLPLSQVIISAAITGVLFLSFKRNSQRINANEQLG